MATTVDQKLLRQTKFPPEFNQKVDIQKVNVEVLKRWIAGKITEILKSEDDIVIELCYNLFEGSRFPDIKSLQISLTGFLDKDAPKFCKELWNLCLSAQSNPQGVPKELLEAKKMELMQEKVDAEKTATDTQQRRDREVHREHEVDTIRQRERGERAERGRGRGGGRGGRGGFEPRRFRDSRSPPPRRRSPFRGPPARREVDTYVPRGRGGHRANGRGRSATRSLSASRSRSPPRRKRRNSSSSRSPSKSPPRKRRQSRSLVGARKNRGESRSRSSIRSDTSRSPSPRRQRQRPSHSARSRSRSPPRRRNRQRSSSDSRSRSRTPPRRRGHGGRRARSSSYSSPKASRKRDDVVGRRPKRDSARLSPPADSDSDSHHSRSSSRSGSRGGRRDDHKRRRSMQRWEPAGRARHNTSSGSSPEHKRQRKVVSEDCKMADAEEVTGAAGK